MQLDDLLATKKIEREDYLAFILFEQTEIGREYLKLMVDGLFMEPANPMYGKIGSVFNDGRRSIFQRIKYAIDSIHKLLREETNEH